MQTKTWQVRLTAADPRHPAIQEAAACVRQGELVAFPTETVYGLGADARAPRQSNGFPGEGTPQDNPLIVHISYPRQLEQLAEIDHHVVSVLAERFWPGPLTLVLPARPRAVSPLVTAGLDTIAVRMPDHPVALSLIEASGCPIAAPSANRSGRPSPTRASHVLDDLAGRVAGVLDGGEAGIGLESTVVAVAADGLEILRPGGISAGQLEEATGIRVARAGGTVAGTGSFGGDRQAPRSPGMKYAHYAPRGRMTVVLGTDREQVRCRIQEEIDGARIGGKRTGVLTYREHVPFYHADVVLSYGRLGYPEETARRLYDALRTFDRREVDYIVAEAVPDHGHLSEALLNRLEKASGSRMIWV